uniref:MFAP1_0 protein n=1 Tax=Fopius arisanus TaxID=64838 RepID=A0A0C9QT14_9HYME
MKKAVVHRYLAEKQSPENSSSSPESVILQLQLTLDDANGSTTQELTTPNSSSNGSNDSAVEKAKEEIRAQLTRLELQQQADKRKRTALMMMQEAICDRDVLILPPSVKQTFDDVLSDDYDYYLPHKLREVKRLQRGRREGEALRKAALIEKVQSFCQEQCRSQTRVNPKMLGKHKYLLRFQHSR